MDAQRSPSEGLETSDNECEGSSGETTDLKSAGVLNSCIGDQTEAREQNMENSNDRAVRAGSTSDLSSVEKRQPPLPPVLLLSSTEGLLTSTGKSHNLKTDTFNRMPPDDDDLCASILLACLFCHPLDCFLATVRGCNQCLCSSLFCCEPATVQSLLNITQHCNVCRCQELCCCQCDCSICDLCLQATECLDLAMEISQILYH